MRTVVCLVTVTTSSLGTVTVLPESVLVVKASVIVDSSMMTVLLGPFPRGCVGLSCLSSSSAAAVGLGGGQSVVSDSDAESTIEGRVRWSQEGEKRSAGSLVLEDSCRGGRSLAGIVNSGRVVSCGDRGGR